MNSIKRARHIGAFSYRKDTVVNQLLSIVAVEFILRGARECEIGLHAPGTLTLVVFRAREMLGIFLNASPLNLFKVFKPRKLLQGDSGRIVNRSVRIRSGNGFRA